MLQIFNEFLKVAVNPCGATFDSIVDKKNNCEILWQGDSKSWEEKDVTIFPFIARLVDGYYTVDGTKYEMPLHGLCTRQVFSTHEHTQEKLILKFEWNQDTLINYPYKFILYKTFELVGNKVIVTMKVHNVGDKTMYYGIGGHPAIALDFDTTPNSEETYGNYICFEEEKTLKNHYLDAKGHFIKRLDDFGKISRLNFDKASMQKFKTYMFCGDKFDKLKIVRKNGKVINFEMQNPPILALWAHEYYGGYVCIEPWWGLPDWTEPQRELSKKEMINALEQDKQCSYTYSIGI